MILIMSGFQDLKMLSAMRQLLVQEMSSTFPCIGKNYFHKDFFLIVKVTVSSSAINT